MALSAVICLSKEDWSLSDPKGRHFEDEIFLWAMRRH
jgi:hypothetical protein